jgi:DNA modification methylase
MGSLFRSQHELVFVYKNGTAPHQNNIMLGKFGRYRTNIWKYPGANSFGKTRDADLADHPTVKPVALIADAIRDCSRRGDTILDPFAGSGTILLAAERTGRQAAAIEIDPHYVDVGVRRWQSSTGQPATLLATGQSFEEVAAERSAAPLQLPAGFVDRETGHE